jgi:hypothetical protein
MTEKNDNLERWTVSEVLEAMSKPGYPEYIVKAVEQIQLWMKEGLDPSVQSGDPFYADYDKLYYQLDWLRNHVTFLGEDGQGAPSEAIVVSLDPGDQDEAMRMAVDHVAIFSDGKCDRVWILSDSWLPGEIFRYRRHMEILRARGVDFHFLLTTPEGWTEIPLYGESQGGPLGWQRGTTGVTGNEGPKGKEGNK